MEGSDRVSEAVAELYGAAPEEFTERRKALGAAARDAGDKAAAAAIAALRKPTRAAWAVNRLSRTDVTAPVRLKELADALRGAQRAMDGRRLRELSATRGPLIDELTQRALAAAGVCDPPPALRDEVAATLTAALADPDVAARFSAGTLTRAEHWSGFGIADVGIADPGTADPGTADPGTADAGTADTGTGSPDTGSRQAADAGGSIGVVSPVDAARAPARGDVAPARTRPRDSGQAAATSRATAREAARRQQQERMAREVAERAAQRREKLEDMERTVASASTAETEAITAEDRLAREVRDLEERLIRARAELANARLRARRAEAAARRARQALDRLGHEPDTE